MSGFPKGLRPSDWMGDLVSKKLGPQRAKKIMVTEFVYPGSHDCATYGEGLADFSYECQDKNLYDQMNIGQRAFDLRLALDEGGKKFIPVHGIAKHTADDFNTTPKEAKENNLASQIMKFAKEHPTEIIVLKVQIDGLDTDEHRRVWCNSAWNLFGQRLLPAPNPGQPRPTHAHAVESNRNIILATGGENQHTGGGEEHPLAKHVWAVGKTTEHWMGDGNQALWNEPDWQSGELSRVLHSTEGWIQQNKERCANRDKFWLAFLQLTPVLGTKSITTFFKDGGSIRPKDLALGGGFGTHGEFKGSNKELRDCGVLKKQLWRKHASCLMYDFADEDTTGAIVAMNLHDDD